MLDPPFDKVYELESIMDRSGVCEAGRLSGWLGGGEGAGALGGAGGGAAGDVRLKALRAAVSASDGACPFEGGGGGGGMGGAELYLYGS